MRSGPAGDGSTAGTRRPGGGPARARRRASTRGRPGRARGGARPHALLDLEEAERWQLRRGRATREQALHRLAEVNRAGPDVGRRGGAGDTKQDRPQRLSADGAPVAGLAEEELHGGPDLLGLEPAEEVRHLPRQLASAPGLGETLAQTGELAERRHAGQNRGNRAASQVSVRPRTARGCSRRGPSAGRRGAGRPAGTDGSGAVRRPDPAAWREPRARRSSGAASACPRRRSARRRARARRPTGIVNASSTSSSLVRAWNSYGGPRGVPQ